MLQHSPSRLGKVTALLLVLVLTYWQKKRWRVLSRGQCSAKLARAELVKVDTDTASLVRWRPPAQSHYIKWNFNLTILHFGISSILMNYYQLISFYDWNEEAL